MKKILLTSLITLSSTFLFAQYTKPDTTKKEFKNVVAIDATGFINQFFNFSNNYFYAPRYVVSYKRLMKQNAFRVGVAAEIYSDNKVREDTVKTKTARNVIGLGLGYEHYSYISKRWNLFIGADAIVSYTNHFQESTAPFNYYKDSQIEMAYGVSPLLGVQFRISERLSVSTESNFDILFVTKTETRTYNVANSIYNRKAIGTRIETRFHPPVSVNFRIMF